jgi:fermentation-respiration switch protein FrsA (DUF1100 family)
VFLLSGDDEVVPYSYQRRVYDAYAGPKVEIERPKAHHNDRIDVDTRARLQAEILHILYGAS